MEKKTEQLPRSYGIAPPVFRLPDTAHVGSVHLQVSDLRQSVAFYEEVLGLRASTVTAETVMLCAHGEEAPLVTLHTRPGVTQARRGAFGLYHFAVLLPDRPALGRFAAHLSSLGISVGMADHRVSESLYLSDPDGLGIEVYSDRPRRTWQSHDRELAMATDPLDITSVIAAGGGEKWAGAPPGTTMGHVHLHVGSLEDAEAFYHGALGFDKTVWSYPGALFLAAGGYHHHLGTNIWAPGPAPSAHHAQLLQWELVVPTDNDVAAVVRSIRDAGYTSEDTEEHGAAATDPWGTRVRIRSAPLP